MTTLKIVPSLPGSIEGSPGVGACLFVHVHHPVVWNFPIVLSILGTVKKKTTKNKQLQELLRIADCQEIIGQTDIVPEFKKPMNGNIKE